MFEAFTQLEETGKQITAFVADASALLKQLANDVAELRARLEAHVAELSPIVAQIARIEASHESIMGFLAEGENDALADAVDEAETAAENAAESAAIAATVAAETVASEASATVEPVVEVVEAAPETETETPVEIRNGEDESRAALSEVNIPRDEHKRARHFI